MQSALKSQAHSSMHILISVWQLQKVQSMLGAIDNLAVQHVQCIHLTPFGVPSWQNFSMLAHSLFFATTGSHITFLVTVLALTMMSSLTDAYAFCDAFISSCASLRNFCTSPAKAIHISCWIYRGRRLQDIQQILKQALREYPVDVEEADECDSTYANTVWVQTVTFPLYGKALVASALYGILSAKSQDKMHSCR